MGYHSTRQCVEDLRRHDQLVETDEPFSPNLEIAEIQRRVHASGGPAILFSNVSGCRFPMVGNLFGTIERARFLFRDTLDNVRRAIELRIDPTQAMRHPGRYWKAPLTAWSMRPRRTRSGPVLQNRIKLSELPGLVSWPDDAGRFITLPQVYSEDVTCPGLKQSNLGMYRIQLDGNRYEPDREVGLHYQIQRSIGVHHTRARDAGQPFRVNIFVGGSPAMTLAAVMPMPEGMSELGFAGALAGHRIPMVRRTGQLPVYGDADFCITGTVHPERLLPEGPFGDHLGYYSLAHDFPVLQVESVYHRKDAIWPFTVVGRPPQEDTMFGQLIHDLTGPLIPDVLPGVEAVHAVDAAGVHPLLLAFGRERYTPWQETTRPQELLTQANAILGQGQLSLAKYLWIADQGSVDHPDIHDIEAFLVIMLERVNWQRDLHFQTESTIDTLDYSGSGLNQGSKLVVAAAGRPRRKLQTTVQPPANWPSGFSPPRVCLPGVLAVEGPAWAADDDTWWTRLEPALRDSISVDDFPLVVVVDDAVFCAASLNNWLWAVFTRSDPARDIRGVDSAIRNKHWGCRGPLVVDARIKPHHAPELREDPETTRAIDALAARGGPLARWL